MSSCRTCWLGGGLQLALKSRLRVGRRDKPSRRSSPPGPSTLLRPGSTAPPAYAERKDIVPTEVDDASLVDEVVDSLRNPFPC